MFVGFRLAKFAATSTSSAGSTGFARCIWNPAFNARMRSSTRPNAVSAIAGIVPPCSAGRFRILRIKEYPSSIGILMSETMRSTSGRDSATIWNASFADDAVSTWALMPKTVATRSRASPSSSTTTIRTRREPLRIKLPDRRRRITPSGCRQSPPLDTADSNELTALPAFTVDFNRAPPVRLCARVTARVPNLCGSRLVQPAASIAGTHVEDVPA